MFIKNSLLAFFLLSFPNNPTYASEQPTMFSIEWFKSFLPNFTQPTTQQNEQPSKTKFQKAVITSQATGKPLDLGNFYNERKSIIDPKESARKFKETINKAAEKNPIMARFKDHPEKFLFGASSSSYQYEGGLDSNNANAIFYKAKGFEPAGRAIDFWNRYRTDIAQMKAQLGINSFRLSIAWDRIQLAPELWNDPNKPLWNQDAIDQYVNIIRLLKKNNIEPIVVLHHYTIPQWFAEIGGFEKYKNIKYFVAFAKKMYEALHADVTYWSTFNAIEGYAFKGYFTLDGPPGTKKSLLTTENVMYNMLAAHAESYKAIKALYKQYKNKDIPVPQIGIQKNIVPLDPAQEKISTKREAFSTKIATTFGAAFQNKMILSLLYYRYYNTLDWIGINIYSNMEMLGTKPQQETNEDRQTANLRYRDYPEGIYRGVKIINDAIAKPLNIPIIITENGIATENNARRTRFFQRALYTIRKLIEEDYPIIGYTPWASHDNYEWPSLIQENPYDRPYGMFAVDFTQDDLPRTLKKGSEYYRDFIQNYFSKEQQ